VSETHAPTVAFRLPKDALQSLIDLLRDDGYSVIGPKVEDAAIVYAELKSIEELPRGYRDHQEPGRYRLEKTDNPNYFEFNVGPHSWKKYLFPPRVLVSSAIQNNGRWRFETPEEPPTKYAFLGVRACELAALAVQDRVFLDGPYVDPIYKARRESALIIAVNCTVAAATCFCTSMKTGPQCRQGFDLALTELDDGFVVEAGSDRGRELTIRLDLAPATLRETDEAGRVEHRAVEQITKHLDTTDIRNLLLGRLDHRRWEDVSRRCLSCTNCTMVCPTCFCSSVTEVADLSGERVERQRTWDSCFNLDFSYTADGIVRNDRKSRYRQWLTHKLATWHDQFDTSGCVGCGRCITWCPVGIDLTEEVKAIRESSVPLGIRLNDEQQLKP
jgi:Fe-S-cluster-containing hydrogenase component 2